MRRLTDQCNNITLSDVIKYLDKMTDMLNAIVQTINGLGNRSELGTIKELVKDLENKLIAQGDIIAELIAGDYGDCRVDEE